MIILLSSSWISNPICNNLLRILVIRVVHVASILSVVVADFFLIVHFFQNFTVLVLKNFFPVFSLHVWLWIEKLWHDLERFLRIFIVTFLTNSSSNLNFIGIQLSHVILIGHIYREKNWYYFIITLILLERLIKPFKFHKMALCFQLIHMLIDLWVDIAEVIFPHKASALHWHAGIVLFRTSKGIFVVFGDSWPFFYFIKQLYFVPGCPLAANTNYFLYEFIIESLLMHVLLLYSLNIFISFLSEHLNKCVYSLCILRLLV